MQHRNDWLSKLPVNCHGRRMLTLASARSIALNSPDDWCICAFGLKYSIAKQVACSQGDYYYVVDENNEPLRFNNVEAAREFLRTQLQVREARTTPSMPLTVDVYRSMLTASLLALRLRQAYRSSPDV